MERRGRPPGRSESVFHRTPGGAHGPRPTKCVVVGRGALTPPSGLAPQLMKKPCHCEPVTDVTGVAIRIPAPTRLFPHPLKKRGGRVATSYKFSVAGEKLLLQLTH